VSTQRERSASSKAVRLGRVLVVVCMLGGSLIAARCGNGGSSKGPASPSDVIPPGPGPSPPPPAATTQIFVGAGDIARCDALEPARQTAQLLQGIGGTVFTLGDNALFGGTAREFSECYEPTWGREKFRTRPALGNHEYEAGNQGNPYFDFFGTNAGPRGLGYYSFDLGAWHAIALNSNLPTSDSSPQGRWLQDDLATRRQRCTLAYWHHPLFTSGQNGPQPFVRDFWRILYDAGADVILSGHDHLYERFGLQDPNGRPDGQRGIRQFTVGSGGAQLYAFPTIAANSEVRLSAYGVLKLTLQADGYGWEFIDVSGAVRDAGSGTCH
jgi:calcineurin-like phosphoesterase family protein